MNSQLPVWAQKKPKSYFQRLDKFIAEWNERFPFDYHYRVKYNIPIFSDVHNNTSFFSMICWWREEVIKNPQQPEEKAKSELEQLLIERKKKALGK